MAESRQSFTPGRLWKEIPTIARVMIFGLWLVAGIVLWNFVAFFLAHGHQNKEDFYIYVALVFLVPGAAIGLSAVAFGYAYYQLCKRYRQPPFWVHVLKD